MCACMHARTCPLAGRDARAQGLEIDRAISVLRSNRRRRCRENQRRAERDRIKCRLHVASPFSLMTSPAYLKISQLSSYFSTDLASMNPIGFEVGGWRNWAARSLFLATKKRADLYASLESQRTYTVTWSARLPSKLARRTIPWRRVHGFHLNGLRRQSPARTSRTCSLRSESCASNPRLDNSPITRCSPDGRRAFGLPSYESGFRREIISVVDLLVHFRVSHRFTTCRTDWR